jgi:hypothetical protein
MGLATPVVIVVAVVLVAISCDGRFCPRADASKHKAEVMNVAAAFMTMVECYIGARWMRGPGREMWGTGPAVRSVLRLASGAEWVYPEEPVPRQLGKAKDLVRRC